MMGTWIGNYNLVYYFDPTEFFDASNKISRATNLCPELYQPLTHFLLQAFHDINLHNEAKQRNCCDIIRCQGAITRVKTVL